MQFIPQGCVKPQHPASYYRARGLAFVWLFCQGQIPPCSTLLAERRGLLLSVGSRQYGLRLFLVPLILLSWHMIRFWVHSDKPYSIYCFCSRIQSSFSKKRKEKRTVYYCLETSFQEQSKHAQERVMICFRSIFYTMMHFGRHTSTRHVWNNGCHNCPVQLINLPSPYNQSVSPLANTGYIPALHERPSFTVA